MRDEGGIGEGGISGACGGLPFWLGGGLVGWVYRAWMSSCLKKQRKVEEFER